MEINLILLYELEGIQLMPIVMLLHVHNFMQPKVDCLNLV